MAAALAAAAGLADFRVYNVWDNGEFLTGATLALIFDGEWVDTIEFTASSEFPNDGTAAEQAAAFGRSYVEHEETLAEAEATGRHPLEIAMDAEYEREMAERF